jgi:hypothetical protein
MRRLLREILLTLDAMLGGFPPAGGHAPPAATRPPTKPPPKPGERR